MLLINAFGLEVGIFLNKTVLTIQNQGYPDRKVHGANMGPICVLSALDGPMNIAIGERRHNISDNNIYVVIPLCSDLCPEMVNVELRILPDIICCQITI